MLATPVTGLAACTVPPGFTYTRVVSSTDCSQTGYPSDKYTLKKR